MSRPTQKGMALLNHTNEHITTITIIAIIILP